MPEAPFELSTIEDFAALIPAVSDAMLESAAGDVRGLFCSCSGCNSACSNDSRP